MGCEYVGVILTVRVPTWELEESHRVLGVGDEVSSWLTFYETDRTSALAEDVQVISGKVRPLPNWPDAGLGLRPVQIDLAGGALYWEATDPAEGVVEVVGTVYTNNLDAPDGFPQTTGVVRRIRMEWQDVELGQDGSWHRVADGLHYEEVSQTYFPPIEIEEPDPEVKADLNRRARQAYDREVASGRIKRGDSFNVVLAAPPTTRRPPGATETRWSGVLIELEITGTRPV